MKNPDSARRAMNSSCLFVSAWVASAWIAPVAFGQITAVDDGVPGSPFQTIDEESALDPGNPVTANDTGSVDILTTSVLSTRGVVVGIDDSLGTLGAFTYNATANGDAQVLSTGGSIEDAFDYTIFEDPDSAVAVTEQLDPDTGVNSFGWSGLPTIVTATGDQLPAPIQTAYEFTGSAASRPAFDGAAGTGDYDEDDFAFEFWLRPDDTSTNQLLFETGGSVVGSGITINDDGTVSYYHSPATNISNEFRTTGALTQGRWHQVVVSLDIDASSTNDRVRIYIDGTKDVDDSSLSNIDDWSGNNGARLGARDGDVGGDTTGTGPLSGYAAFDGQLGVMNFHSVTIPDDADVTANFNAWSSPATDTATVTVGITGVDDAPEGIHDILLTGPSEDGPVFTSTRDLTANDGNHGAYNPVRSAGSDLTLSGLNTISVSQSPTSASPPGNGFASNAIDGSLGNYSHTEVDNTVVHTWQVDFGVDAEIENVTLQNRTDCCAERLRDITITIEDESGTVLATSGPLNPGNVLGFSGNGGGMLFHDFAAGNGGVPVTGRRVVVTRTPDVGDVNEANGSVLSLAEVTVIGSTSGPAFADDLALNHDARFTTGAGVWENLGNLGGSEGDWVLGSGVTLNASVTSARAQISAAFEWDGTTDATAAFRKGSIEGLGGASVDQQSVTFEVWARLDPADLSQISTLFETGGATGLGMVVDNGVLRFGTGNGDYVLSYDLVSDPQSVMGGLAPTAEFFQAAATLDMENDRGYLFVNGRLVATGVNPTNDWSGGNQAGLGRLEGANHGGFEAPLLVPSDYDTHYHGSIASFRMWRKAMTEGLIRQNFEAVASGTDVDGDSLSVTGVVDATGAVVGLSTPTTLPSGALVTLDNSTGAFTYDPNGSFESLTAGETARDHFVYEISDGTHTGYARVSIPVSGRVDAADDTVAATELVVTTLPANLLVGNDQREAGTAGAYFRIDPADLAGGTIPNTGSGGSTYDVTVNGGVVINPPDLASNFGAIAAALQNGSGSFNSLDPISTNDATFEIWFQPQPFQSGQQMLLDSGGNGFGLSIVYDADLNRIVFTVDGGDNTDDIIQAIATGVVPGEFNQLVAIYDKDHPTVEDNLVVYLNSDPTTFDGTIKGSGINAAGTANDWAGGDPSGLGDYTSTAALGETPSPFIGQIGITRIYPTQLSLAEIESNFDSVVQPIASLVGGSPLTTALGAVVTLNADGSIDYDASSLNADIPEGDVAQDSFQYTLSDGAGGSTTATVTVDVTGVGNFLAVDDDFDISEDAGTATLDVRANDLDATAATVLFQELESSYASDLTTFAGTATSGDPADFRDGSGYGWRLMWNPPTDWDLLNDPASSDGTGGALGDEANYVPLIWTGNEWTPDGDEDNANNAPAAFATLLPGGSGHPGSGATNAGTTGNDEDRAAIAAYTVPSTGYYGVANSTITSNSGSSGGIRVLAYVGNSEQLNVPVAGGATSTFDGALGLVNQGDTIYIALSPDGAAASDSFTWDFDLVALPGPDAVPSVTFGSVTTDGANLLYTPASEFQALKDGESVTETISYTIDDGGTLSTATATVTINGANDLPVGGADDGGITNENQPLAGGGLLANDTDADTGETLTLVVGAVQGSPASVGVATATDLGGSVIVAADGSFSYDPTGAFEALTLGDPDAVDTFTYTVQDENGADAAVPTTVSITVVGLEANAQPIGSDLTQTIDYLDGSAEAGMFSPPAVSDPNSGSPVSSSIAPEYSTTASVLQDGLTNPGLEAEHEAGMSVALRFTPTTADVALGSRVCVYNNGGTSNGNGIYLLDGIPHFICALNSAESKAPVARTDTEWGTDEKISVPLAGTALPAGVPTEIGLSFQLDRVGYTVNGGAPVFVELTARPGGNWNWSGDDTITFGDLDSAGSRGALSSVAGDFDLNTYTGLAGDFDSGAIWYVGQPDQIGLTPELLTATLTVNPAEGDLSAPDGASYAAGTWTASGTQERINALLAATTFVPNGTSPVDVAISIADGGEAGTTAETGTLTFQAVVADEGTDSDGDGLSDFLELAFGTDPGNADNGDLALDGSINGRPIVNIDFTGGLTFEAVFIRRDDHGLPGSLQYTVEFSGDLSTWEPSPASPTVLADSSDDADYEVASVPYPFFVDGKKARFFRVRVEPVN